MCVSSDAAVDITDRVQPVRARRPAFRRRRRGSRPLRCPTVSRPSSPVAAGVRRRPAARLRRAARRVELDRDLGAVPLHATHRHPVRTSTPRSPQRVGDLLARERLLARRAARGPPRPGSPSSRARPTPARARRRPRRRRGRAAAPGHARGRRLPVRPRIGLGQAGDRRQRGPRSGATITASRARRAARRRRGYGARRPAAPRPRTSVTSRSSSQGSCTESSSKWITSSRRRKHGLRVELPVDGLAGTGHPLRLGQRLVRAQQRLRGHAAVVRALAPDQMRLHDRHVQAGLAEPPGGDLARRTGADHDDVELAHVLSSVAPHDDLHAFEEFRLDCSTTPDAGDSRPVSLPPPVPPAGGEAPCGHGASGS